MPFNAFSYILCFLFVLRSGRWQATGQKPVHKWRQIQNEPEWTVYPRGSLSHATPSTAERPPSRLPVSELSGSSSVYGCVIFIWLSQFDLPARRRRSVWKCVFDVTEIGFHHQWHHHRDDGLAWFALNADALVYIYNIAPRQIMRSRWFKVNRFRFCFYLYFFFVF
jgi:hypothetical protein